MLEVEAFNWKKMEIENLVVFLGNVNSFFWSFRGFES